MLVFNIKQVNLEYISTTYEAQLKTCNSNLNKKLTYANRT
jgi:hypothetical protein